MNSFLISNLMSHSVATTETSQYRHSQKPKLSNISSYGMDLIRSSLIPHHCVQISREKTFGGRQSHTRAETLQHVDKTLLDWTGLL